MAVRLNKYLADRGVGARRKCDELIAQGRVSVNGKVVSDAGRKVEEGRDKVSVDGRPVAGRSRNVYYVLNKPVGVITTLDDPQGRRTVVDLVPAEPRVFPVGRLDADTEGLLLLTNDGELTHRLTHPSFGVEKEYVAEVQGKPSRLAVRRLREGVELDDGVTAPAKVALIEPNVLRLVIHEGRNRQVRRMCEAVGLPVEKLIRVALGPLALGNLPAGAWRYLEPEELARLRAATTRGPSAVVDEPHAAGRRRRHAPRGRPRAEGRPQQSRDRRRRGA